MRRSTDSNKQRAPVFSETAVVAAPYTKFSQTP